MEKQINELVKTMSSILRQERLTQHLSQEKLAKKAGISQTTLNYCFCRLKTDK